MLWSPISSSAFRFDLKEGRQELVSGTPRESSGLSVVLKYTAHLGLHGDALTPDRTGLQSFLLLGSSRAGGRSCAWARQAACCRLCLELALPGSGGHKAKSAEVTAGLGPFV